MFKDKVFKCIYIAVLAGTVAVLSVFAKNEPAASGTVGAALVVMAGLLRSPITATGKNSDGTLDTEHTSIPVTVEDPK